MDNSKEFVDGFLEVVNYFKIDKKDLATTAKPLAQLINTYVRTKSTNTGVVDASLLHQFDSRLDFLLTIKSNNTNTLEHNKTEIMRFLLDLLFIKLRNRNLSLDATYPAHTKEVVSVFLNKQYMGRQTKGYVDIQECYSLMEVYLSFCDTTSEFDDTFKFVEDCLKKLRILCDKKNQNGLYLNENESVNIYLPKKYKSYGFTVTDTLPKSIENSVGDKKDIVEQYNLMNVADLLLMFFAGTKSDKIYVDSFASRLLKVNDMKDIIPIGVGSIMGQRKEQFIPNSLLKNDGMKTIYNNTFSTKSILTRSSVDELFLVLTRVFKVEV